jgi:hypothetical protein
LSFFFFGNVQEKFFRKAHSTKDADITGAIDLVRAAEEVDLVFLFDATGSMGSHIDGAKKSIGNVVKRVRITNPDLKLRIACVCYRDIHDFSRHELLDFTTGVGAFGTFLGTVNAVGGDDAAEDIAGALTLACGLPWSSATRLIFHIADAPCHGRKLHDFPDAARHDLYPGGDPAGTCPVKMLNNLKVRAKLHRSDRSSFMRKESILSHSSPLLFTTSSLHRKWTWRSSLGTLPNTRKR